MGTENIRPAELGYLHVKSPHNQNRLGRCLTRGGKDFNVCMSNAYMNDAYVREVYMSNESSTSGTVSDTASGTSDNTMDDILSDISSDTASDATFGTESATSESTSDNTSDDTMEAISDNTSVSTSDDIPYEIEDDSVSDGTGADIYISSQDDIYITPQDLNEDDVMQSIEWFRPSSHPVRDITNLEEWPEQSLVVEDLKESHHVQNQISALNRN